MDRVFRWTESMIDDEQEGFRSDNINREALWQVMRMYDVSDKLLNGIKGMYISSLASVRVN